MERESVTQLLVRWGEGDREALERLMPLVERELRRIAGGYLKRERVGHTLQPTALVNEAYLRLVDQADVRWQNRAHFVGIGAQMMRRILVDHARKHQASKRGGDVTRVTFNEDLDASDQKDFDLIALDQALERLSQMDARQGTVVELRFFGGLSVDETAIALGVSTATVKREWSTARAWLYKQLRG